MNGRYRWNF
jgi:hypothetical protein